MDTRHLSDDEIEARVEAAASERAPAGLSPVLEQYRARLERMLRFRLDGRLAGRVGVSDIVQDAYLEVAERLPAYLDERADASTQPDASDSGADLSSATPATGAMPFYPWVRFIAAQALARVHRRHLGTVARDAGRDRLIGATAGDSGHGIGAGSGLFASALIASEMSPSGAAQMEERREGLVDALDRLSDPDREVLFLRHFEQLSNREIAAILGMTESGASLRHLKALGRLQRTLERSGFGFDPA